MSKIIKLTCGDTYDMDISPCLQNLSNDGIKEMLELYKKLGEYFK